MKRVEIKCLARFPADTYTMKIDLTKGTLGGVKVGIYHVHCPYCSAQQEVECTIAGSGVQLRGNLFCRQKGSSTRFEKDNPKDGDEVLPSGTFKVVYLA